MYAAGGINPPKNREAARKSSKTGKTVNKNCIFGSGAEFSELIFEIT